MYFRMTEIEGLVVDLDRYRIVRERNLRTDSLRLLY